MNHSGRREGIPVSPPEKERVGEKTEQPVISGEEERQEAPQVVPPSEAAPPPPVSKPIEAPAMKEEQGITVPTSTLNLEDVSDSRLEGQKAKSNLIQKLNAGLEAGPESD